MYKRRGRQAREEAAVKQGGRGGGGEEDQRGAQGVGPSRGHERAVVARFNLGGREIQRANAHVFGI